MLVSETRRLFTSPFYIAFLHRHINLSLAFRDLNCHCRTSSPWTYGFEYGLQTGFVDGFVGDGLLSDCDSLWEMSAVGAFSSFLTPSVGFFALLSNGDDDDDADVLGGRVLTRRGTKALRTSSVGESLQDVLPLGGDELDGLLISPPVAGVDAVVVIVVVTAVSAA